MRNLDALLDAIENLQGAPLPASLLESSILPARIADYAPAGLDTLIAAGEVAWAGVEPIGERDGRIALFLADKLPLLAQQRPIVEPLTEREEKLLAVLESTGASFFDPLHQAVGGGYPGETIEALWSLVWRGLITNDSLHALRAYIARPESARTPRRLQTGAVFRSRRTTPPTAQGRWSLLPLRRAAGQSAEDLLPSATEASHALALQLLNRYGVLMRESVAAENVPGGFSAVYDVLKALEESGRIRRGYFVAGLGATQFALPAAVDLLRQLRTAPPAEKPEFVQLAATDPANPYGSVLRWPDLPVAEEDSESAPRILTRAAYAEVILRNGQLVAWLRRGNPNLLVFLPAEEPERSQIAAGLAHFLCSRGQERMRASSHQGVLITTINGQPVAAHPMARFLMDAGFHPGPLGMHLRRIPLAMGIMHEPSAITPARCSKPMPEGDTIFRTARTLGRALAGKPVTVFRSTYPLLTRFNDDTPLAGQLVERVEARGKWLLIHFSGGGTLATHMLMNGSWHIYRHGERWQQPRTNMRIVIENSDFVSRRLSRAGGRDAHRAIARARPENSPAPRSMCSAPTSTPRSRCDRVLRPRQRRDRRRASPPGSAGRRGQRLQVGDLLCHRHQSILQSRRRSRPSRCEALDRRAQKLVAANVLEDSGDTIVTYRRPAAPHHARVRSQREPVGLWPQRRALPPLRRADSPPHPGPDARVTFWCQHCQPMPDGIGCRRLSCSVIFRSNSARTRTRDLDSDALVAALAQPEDLLRRCCA